MMLASFLALAAAVASSAVASPPESSPAHAATAARRQLQVRDNRRQKSTHTGGSDCLVAYWFRAHPALDLTPALALASFYARLL